MGGCNDDLATTALRKIAQDKQAFQSVPVFLSTGTKGRMSTVAQYLEFGHF